MKLKNANQDQFNALVQLQLDPSFKGKSLLDTPCLLWLEREGPQEYKTIFHALQDHDLTDYDLLPKLSKSGKIYFL